MAEKTSSAAKTESQPASRGGRQAPPSGAPGLAATVLDLQRAAGNQSVGRLLGGSLFQPKLRIGPPGDAYEREADRVADAVLRDGGTAPVSVAHAGTGVQRMCAECEEELLQKSPAEGDPTDRTDRTDPSDLFVQRACHCQENEEELLQPKSEGGPSQPAPGFEARVEALRGAGRPLPTTVRSFFEPRFGNDFGAVRVHTGAAAGEAAEAVRARAFTVGNDVVFGAGEWSPETTGGKRLLAHELTHVVQQTPLVARRQPLLQRAPLETGEEGAPAEDFAPEPAPEEGPAPETSPGEPASEAAAADQTPAVALIVEDDATEMGEGQMKKSDFLAQLRPAVLAAAEAGLSDKSRVGQVGSFLELWLGEYEAKDAEQINRDLQRLVPGERRPTTAEGYIAAVAERVRTAVATWERTGELPPELSSFGSERPGAGGLLGGLASVFFKALPGGPRNPGSPQALQAELGAGRPLDGGVRSRMESAFGRGFSHVRVHADGRSAGLSHRLNARAFTVGEHVAFGSRQYQPGTVLGDALLAHELAHVAQQDGASAAVQPMRADTASYGALERDADMAAVGAVASLWGLRLPGLRRPLQAAPRLSSGLRLQRCSICSQPRAAAQPVQAPTRPVAPTPPAACQPTPVSYQTLAAETGEAGLLGYTKLDPSSELICAPQLARGSTPGTCTATPMPLRMAFISKHVRKGDHPSGEVVQIPNCPGPTPIVFRVSDEVERLAIQGEQEHCGDLKVAYDRTLKPCGEALSRLAGATLMGQNDEQCFADLVQKLGFDPLNCTQEFLRLSKDQRDAQDWHTFEPYVISRSCQEAVAGFKPVSQNRIGDGSVKPETLVPQATGCSSTASPSAPASPTQAPAPPTPPQPGRTRFTLGIDTAQADRVADAGLRDSGAEPVPEPAPETSPGEPASEAATAEQAPAATLIVEDDAAEIGDGQMKKSDFLAQLRPAVLAAAEAGLSDKSRVGQVGSFLELWLGEYEAKDAEQINRDLQRLVPGERRPTTAEGYIAAVAERVRTAVATWERTGELPPELSSFGSERPGAGGLLGGLSSVFFKALPGGPRNPGSPQALRAELGAGRPLDGGVRSRMESAFGRSFSHVKVHADGRSAGLSHRLNARAFTVGEHVAFGSRQYQPGTVLGDALLAHELAHVAQQDGASESVQPMRADAASYGALERDADMAAVGAVASLWGLRLPGLRRPLQAAPRLSSGLRLQRCGNCNGQAATPGKASPRKDAQDAPGPATAPEATPGPPVAEAPAPAVTFCATESDHAGIIALRAKAGLAAPKGTLAYGFTFWSPKNSATKPKLEIDWTKAGSAWTGTVKRTTVAMGTIEALYLKEGDHEIPGKKVKANGPQCGAGGKDVPFVSNLSKDLSLLSRSAEQEHCNDYRRAYDLTYQKWADNINALAGKSFGPGTQAAVKTQIDGALSKMGDKGRNGWVAELDRLNALSASARDDSGWHSLKPDGAPVGVDATCTKVQGTTVKSVNTNVPGPSSEDLVK